VACEKGACAAISAEDLEDTRWETGFDDEGTEGEGGEWGLLGWFEDEDVSCCESWGGFETDGSEGPIPGDDTTGYTDGFVADDFEEAVFLGPGFTGKFVDPACVVFECLDGVSIGRFI
jgi:hypothetical protein